MKFKLNYDIINNVTTTIDADSYEDALSKLDVFNEDAKFDALIDTSFINRKSNYFTYRLLSSETLETVKKKVDVLIHFDVDAIKTFEVEVDNDDENHLRQQIREQISSVDIDDCDLDIQSSEVDTYNFRIQSVNDCKEEVAI